MLFYYLEIAIDIILLAVLVYVIFLFLIPPLWGAPYVPSSKAVVARMLGLAKAIPGERMVDLGSGDGRIVIAFALAGVEAHGYEINPLLVLISRLIIRCRGLQPRAHIHWQSFRSCDFSEFNIVTIYGFTGIMAGLEKKLQTQLPASGRVVSYVFRFPAWQPSTVQERVYLYKISLI